MKRSKRLFLTTLILLVLCAALLWTSVRYKNQAVDQKQIADQNRVSYVETLVRTRTSFPLTLTWQVNLDGYAYDYPAYRDGLVFLPTTQPSANYWYGIDANTGHVIWQRETEMYGYRRCLTDGYLVLSGLRSFVNLRLHTGEIVWQKSRAGTAGCSEETVFFSEVPRYSISAADLTTGQNFWVGTQPKKSFDGLIYNPEANELLATYGEEFFIVEPDTGLIKNSFPIVGSAPQGGPPWEQGSIYLVDRGELFLGGTVLDAKTGHIIHKENRYGSQVPPTVSTNVMYLASASDGVVAFSRPDYEVKWIYPSPFSKPESDSFETLSSVALLDETGYVIFSDATLRAFDLETGQELGYWQPSKEDLWNWRVCTYPAPRLDCVESARAGLTTSENMLFASFGDGKLYAFEKPGDR